MQKGPIRIPTLLVPLALLAPLSAQEQSPATIESFVEISNEYEQASRNWSEAYSKASPDERAVILKKRPDPADFADRMMRIVERAPASEDAGAAAIWVVSRARPHGPRLARALEVIAEHHGDAEDVKSLAFSLSRNPVPLVTRFLERQSQRATATARGQMMLALAEHLKNAADTIRRLGSVEPERVATYERLYGREAVDVLKAADAASYEARAVKTYETILADEELCAAPFVGGKVGETAKRSLFELQHLSIGKVAPDIVGEDIDGTPMKLSDYRGKVVVLDFWGDW